MRRKKVFFKLIIFLFSVLILSTCLYFSSNRILLETGEKSFYSVISNSSYFAVESVMNGDYGYKDLVIIEKNSSGDVTMIMTESKKVNELATNIAIKTYEIINERTNEGVDIPLGAFSGIRLISGFGEKINMKLLTVSSVKCNIVSEFQEAGINQTRHLMYVDIVSEVSIITKVSKRTVSDVIRILAYDNLIVGKVPLVLSNSSVIGSGDKKV